MDTLAEITRLYYQARRDTIHRDLARAIALLKAMDTDEERERAAVYMNGLSQMRSDWVRASRHGQPATPSSPSRRRAPRKAR